jgi:prophage regulatory protein
MKGSSAEARSLRMIRLREVMNLVPLGRSTIYDRMAAGNFPLSHDLGGGVVCWRECEVLAWIEALPKKGQQNKLGVGEGVAAETNVSKAA